MKPTMAEHDIQRPWLAHHPAVAHGQGPFKPRFDDALSLFRHAVHIGASQPAAHYFDGTLTYGELDRLTDAFARALVGLGVGTGDRVALYLQNVPQFVIGLVGAWKAGAIGVSINPMNRARELKLLLQDSGARVLVLHPQLHEEVAREVLAEFPGVQAITTDVRDFQTRNDARLMGSGAEARPTDTIDLLGLLATAKADMPLLAAADPKAPAAIVYTSGTTGIPKGAMITHAGFAFGSDLWRAWADVRDGAPILGIAPLFHITGLLGHVGFAFAAAAPLILALRFHPEVVAEAAQEHKAEFVVGAITAFIAIMNAPGVTADQFATLRRVYSGGAPVPASVAAEINEKLHFSVRNCYGLTESTSLAVGVPPLCDTPVDANGAYSIGIPVFSTDVVVAGDDGRPLPLGEVGEITIRGPQTVPGYWQRPNETAEALVNGFLKTGDVGYMNEQGWLFIVDRKKDMISASGYKVWPKEVEDVIYTHPAVREVAVVGVADGYRGETVKAVVSLKPGCSLNEAELIAFCKERMAAYKYPRLVQVLDELPKTVTGKILRRELRAS